jgi:zinc transporter ZupT
MAARRRLTEQGAPARRAVAWLIALGIGLHNLGEGLAIGAAYSLGEASLGAFLVIGFMLHNSTEGLGIVAPIAQDRPSVKTLAALGLLAGGPTILGAWIGGMAYSPLWATLFLAIGAGAIAQVVIALYRVVARESEGLVWTPLTAGGMLAGMLVMYATGLLVAA